MKRMEKVKKENEEYTKNELRRKRRKELSKKEFAIAEELDRIILKLIMKKSIVNGNRN